MTEGRIALDAMGGDDAPEVIVDGALASLSGEAPLSPDRLILVGDEPTIDAIFALRGGNPGIEVRHASERVEMSEDPRSAMRSKPDNSISRSAELVKAGDCVGLVSMGNTGMVVAASTLLLGRLPGIRMPGIAVTVGFTGRPMVLVDMGANVDASAENLLHDGIMGAIYAQDCLGIETPSVALLNVGEEAAKGSKRSKEAHALLSNSGLAFIGNVEGSDVFAGKADVVVTDGFTGNVILKLLEQFGAFVLRKVLTAAEGAGIELPKEVSGAVNRDLDYAEYGGALLLGVEGVVVIGHGRSDSRAVGNGLKQAARAADAGVNQHIIAGLEACGMA